MDESCPIEKLEKAGKYQEAAVMWRENIEVMLKNSRHTIRVKEGGGPESLLDSLILTFMRLEDRADRK
jgi:hypothetical protein